MPIEPTPALVKSKTPRFEYVGDDSLEKATLPSGRVILFKSAADDEIEAAIKEYSSLEKYFKKG